MGTELVVEARGEVGTKAQYKKRFGPPKGESGKRENLTQKAREQMKRSTQKATPSEKAIYPVLAPKKRKSDCFLIYMHLNSMLEFIGVQAWRA